MLDDLKYIHQRDGSDALGIAERQSAQLSYQFERPRIPGSFANIVYAGMGGSALAALLSHSWPGYRLPFEVCRQYHIPAYVGENTLFIAASYSGNTEETLSALSEAEQKKATIAVIAGGGKLEEIALAKGYPYLKLPKAEQPRYAVFYNLVALLTILEDAGLVNEVETVRQLEKAGQFLAEKVKAWVPTVPQSQNPAKLLAQELAGKAPAIYAGPLLAPAAYKWKISFNENAKNVAWWNELPEFDHNELTGWSSHPIQKPYGVVELRSNLENPRVQKRFEVGEKLLSGLRPAPNVVNAEGENLLEQLVWTTAFGDFVSIYLALLNGVNPAPVDLVEKFKKELG
ncbi:MAG TPA: bifunctional phosphoglucose/phosphomannose isomerase [Candidatus Saccharimonadales bacterium]|nr:bifunctional phosphoglucose/phosphomannose isomerase [Candidatus Saccharimonadales bacterium]